MQKLGENFEKLYAIVARKAEADAMQEDGYDAETYLRGAADELAEVWEELAEKNAVYLEDELGDVLWDYFLALKRLEQDGRIRSVENVFGHAVEKYAERWPEGQSDMSQEGWDMVKKGQKKRLQEENEEYQQSL